MLDALKVFDFAKAVVDNEIALMLKRLKRGVEFGEQEFAIDVMAAVGPGGSFMVQPHTVKRMKTVAYLPSLADRNARAQWESKGALDTHARAMARVREILADQGPPLLTPEIEARIRLELPELVPGELEMPEGWAAQSD